MKVNEYSDQLYHAIVENNEEEFERLLSEGGDLNQPRSFVNFTDYSNVYPLEIACEKSVKMAYRLLEEGADPTVVDGYIHCTPLIFCVSGDDPLRFELAMKLIELGADPEHIDDNNGTVLKHIAFMGEKDDQTTMEQSLILLQYLYDNYDVEKVMDQVEDTVLNVAVRYDNMEMTKYILDHNLVNINVKGQGGRTPLMDSLRNGNVEMCKYLLSCGASKEGTSNKGKTCLDFAKESENEELIDLMK